MSFLLRLLHRIPPYLTGFARSLLPYIPRSSTPMHFSSEGRMETSYSVHLREESGLARDRRLVTIDVLPDNVLVDIFNFCEDVDNPRWYNLRNTWHTLVHVCHRWRYLVFASPRRLNLRLTYRGHRPMSEALDAWPVLPVSLMSDSDQLDQQWDNAIAALESELSNRISEIEINMIPDFLWERFAAAMQKPFPELTHLQLWKPNASVPVLPDSFLAGSAPRLRTLWLGSIPFPSLPKLRLSANHLLRLTLWDIPDSGYFPPDAIATSLAAMTRLESLTLGFHSPRSRPNPESRSLPPPTRFVLHALTQLEFKGDYEYLEDLLSRIDAPYLYFLSTTFFMNLDFDVSQLYRLISHAEKLKTFDRANVTIYNSSIRLRLYPNTGAVDRRRFQLQIICRKLGDQLSSLRKICSSSFLRPFISALEELQIEIDNSTSLSHDIENAQWLELLDPFTALKKLYLYSGVTRRFCGAFQELSGERTTEVLPALRNIFVQGSSLEPVQEATKSFVTARQLSGHPVVVDNWKD